MNKIYFYFLVLTLFSCCEDMPKTQLEKLNLLSEVKISVVEPSGMSFNSNKTFLYVVSDNTAKVYKLSLSGALIGTLEYEGVDLEGVTVDSNTGDIIVVEERKREIVRLNKYGKEIKRSFLDIENNKANSGLEGITFNKDNRHLYVLNEKDPGLLIELDGDGSILKQTELEFASDYSGIFYEENEKKLWIISDQSRTVTKCDLEGKKIISYKLNSSKAEGVVVDIEAKKIYIVLDGMDKMQVYGYN
jgi:uncharacterized protein YjiK